MRIGSIIELIKPFDKGWDSLGIQLPQMYVKYTVRGFYTNPFGDVGVYLEEIINDEFPGLGMEPSFLIEFFRELEFPDDLTEEINEALDAPIPVKEPVYIQFVGRRKR